MTPYARRRTPASSLGAAAVAAAAASTTPPASAPTDCASTVPTADLAEFTDPAGIESFDDARSRVTQLRGVLTRNADYRGTFALAFDEILALTEPTLTSGIYDDPVWAEALALEVARLYLANLHEYVTGAAPAAHWAAAFAETGRCERSPGRVLLGAIVAHLVIDMPEALVTIGSTPGHTRDFYTFGEALVALGPA